MKKTFCCYTLVLIVLSLINISPIYSQTESSGITWPQGLGFANQLEYSYNVDGDFDILEKDLFE